MQKGIKKVPNPKSMIHLPRISMGKRKKVGKKKVAHVLSESFEDSKENKERSRTEKATQQRKKNPYE